MSIIFRKTWLSYSPSLSAKRNGFVCLGQANKADKLAKRLEFHRRQAAGSFESLDPKQTELHVVGVYEGDLPDGAPRQRRQHAQGQAVVEIGYAEQPIVLALAAYEPVKWQVKAHPKANIKEIILGGYYDQEVEGAPARIPIRKETHAGGRPYFYAHARDEQFARMERILQSLTGLNIATFQGRYRYEGKPFVIGPTNDEWKFQLIRQQIASTHRDAVRYQRAQQRQSVEHLKFPAMHVVLQSIRGRSPEPYLLKSLADFTPAGPVHGTNTPLPGKIDQIAVDPNTRLHFVIHNRSFAELNAQTGQLTARTDPILGQDDRPGALAFDTRRGQVLISTVAGHGKLLAYEPNSRKWKQLASLDDCKPSALAYSPDEDVIYGLLGDHGQAALVTFTSDGAVLRRVTVPPEVLEARRSRFSHDPFDSSFGNSYQLATVGRLVIILVPPVPSVGLPANENEQELPEEQSARSYLIDPRTGRLAFTSHLEMRPGLRDLTDAELARIWESLLTPNSERADDLIWQLAAGGNKTVAYLRKQRTDEPKPSDQNIAELIKQLDDDNFNTRDRASHELSKLGQLAAEQLKAALKSTSPEVRNRARKLVSELERGESSDPETRRNLRAVTVLERLANPRAIEYLEELAARPGAGLWSKPAQDALLRISER